MEINEDSGPAITTEATPTRPLSENDIVAFVTGLSGVVAETASEATAAPELAWGDTFIFYDPDGDAANRRMPFATIVTKDYGEFDSASNLNRPGVFRLNIVVGRTAFQDLIGYPPAAHADHHESVDYAAFDRLLPHPVYARQAWVAILNPGAATVAQARSLLTAAHKAQRHRPRA